MDRSQEQIREDGRQIPSPLALTLRRDRLSQLLARHVALIDEIQRSAKELTSGQDEYIASQIDRLRRAANDVHRAAAPVDQPVSAGRSGPWSAEHPCSHSPRSSNDEVLFNRKDSRPIATPQIPHPMVLPQASSGCLPTSIPRLNSSMSCDELLSMLDSVTNPGAVSNGRKSKSTSKDNANKDNTTGGGGSPVSRKRALRDTSSDGTDAPMPLLPPPAFRRNYSNNNMAEITHHHQQQPYRSATPTPTPPMPVAPNSTGQVQYMSAASPMMHHPPPLPRGHGSVNHLVAPHQTDTLAPSPFSTTAPSSQGPPPPQQQQRNQQQSPPQVYHHHHHHPAPMQQQQQQHHYSSGPPPPPPPMMSTPLPHVHSHHHLQQQQQQHYSSAPLPMQGVGMSYPPPRQMPMSNGMQPPMRQMSPTPYGNMMGMPLPPPGWHNGPVMPPPHLRMNMVGPLPHPYMGPPSMMGPPPRRGPLGLTGVAPPPGMLPMHHSHPPQYVTRPMSAPSPPPTMQMSMHAAAAALAAAPVAVNALNAQKMPPSTIPVPSGLPPVRVTPPPPATSTPALPAGGGGIVVNGKAANNETSLNLDDLSLPPMPSAQLLADLPSLSPHTLLSPAGGLGDPSALSSLPLTMPHKDMVNGNDPFQDINHIHLSPEEFDAVLAAFDTPGLEDAQT